MKEKYCLKLIFNEEIGCQEIFIAEKMTDKLIDKKEAVKLLNDYETRIQDLEQEQIQEMQEHQKAILLADKTIKETREKVIEEIIAQLSKIEDTLINCGNGKEDALAYFLEILKKVKGENNE